jgi:hypothetical protein
MPNGEWYFAALTISPDQGKLYLNGVEQTLTNTEPHREVVFDSQIRVGRDHSDDRIQTSLIDEVRLYNKTLTDAEILALATPHIVDVTGPADVVKGVPDEPRDGDVAGWPDNEHPALALDDDVSTKFLHFRGDASPTGFVVEPAMGATVVTGLTLTTANDAEPRDPASYEISGSNESIDGPYELIAAGDLVDFTQEAVWPRFTMNATPITFANTVAYKYYQVLFPTVRDAGSANSMQIAEVELLGVPAPIGHWPLDGDAVDLSGNGNDGVLMGDPQFAAGMVGEAIDLDGVDDYVDLGNADLFDITGAMTVACWIKVDVFDKDWQAIVTHGDSSWRIHRSGGTDNIAWGTSGAPTADITGTANVNDAEWHHIAGVFTGTQKFLYVDGAVDASGDFAGSINSSAVHSVNIGENNQATGRYFDGLIDDVRIYDVGIHALQVRDLMSPPAPAAIYAYEGDALDEMWDHDNGSDQWDGTGPGEGNPGGAASLTEDGVTFLRIQDTGDPRDLGIGEPSNRKVYLTRLTDISLDGLTLEVRMRIATTPPLDNQISGDPWPAEGIGYHIRDGGKGMIGVSDGVGIISFSLAQPGEPMFEDVATDVLVMNNLVGTEPTSDVDTDNAAAAVALNMMAIDDATQWNTFVIDIVAGGAGTHVVTVSANGGPAESFDVTLGSDMEADAPFITIGSSGTGGITAFDVDYLLVR